MTKKKTQNATHPTPPLIHTQEAHVRQSRSQSLERWDSASQSRAGPGPEGLAPAGSSRILGFTHDSASMSEFGDRRGGGGIGRGDSAAGSVFGDTAASHGGIGIGIASAAAGDSASGSGFAEDGAQGDGDGDSDGGVGEEKVRG